MKNISNEGRQRISTIVAFAIVPISGFATDIYIPWMPSMGSELKITSLQVQLTLTAFLISYGTAQLFIGAFLDTFRRYKLGLTALFVFTMASIIVNYGKPKKCFEEALFEGKEVTFILCLFTMWSQFVTTLI